MLPAALVSLSNYKESSKLVPRQTKLASAATPVLLSYSYVYKIPVGPSLVKPICSSHHLHVVNVVYSTEMWGRTRSRQTRAALVLASGVAQTDFIRVASHIVISRAIYFPVSLCLPNGLPITYTPQPHPSILTSSRTLPYLNLFSSPLLPSSCPLRLSILLTLHLMHLGVNGAPTCAGEKPAPKKTECDDDEEAEDDCFVGLHDDGLVGLVVR